MHSIRSILLIILLFLAWNIVFGQRRSKPEQSKKIIGIHCIETDINDNVNIEILITKIPEDLVEYLSNEFNRMNKNYHLMTFESGYQRDQICSNGLDFPNPTYHYKITGNIKKFGPVLMQVLIRIEKRAIEGGGLKTRDIRLTVRKQITHEECSRKISNQITTIWENEFRD